MWGAEREGGNRKLDLGRSDQNEGEAPSRMGMGRERWGRGTKFGGLERMRGGIRGVGNGRKS